MSTDRCTSLWRKALRATASLLAVSTMAFAGSAAAEVDFSGERITLIVPFSEGGGTDSYSRFMAPYFEKHLPGNPKILIVNRPGGGGLTGVNYYAARAQKDGTWVLALSTSSLSNYMLGDKRAKFEVSDFTPIILSPRGITQYVRSTLGIDNKMSLEEKLKVMRALPKEQLVFGGKTPTSGGLALRVALDLLGIEVNSVWGLGGNGPMALAFERGEFTVNYDNTLSFLNNRAHMIKTGLAVPLYTFGILNEDGTFSRDPALPDVPTFVEAYEAVNGKKPSGPQYDAWVSLMSVSVPLSKSWNLPADAPKEVVETWRTAARAVYEEVMNDPRGAKIFGPYPNIMTDAAAKIMQNATRLEKDSAKWLAGYVNENFNVQIAAKTK